MTVVQLNQPFVIDIIVADRGTLIGFAPASRLARTWFAENVSSEPWQWAGPTLWVDHRLAQQLRDGISDEGLGVLDI